MSRKILITGGTGFLGAYIIKELISRGYSVRAIHRSANLPTYIDKQILDQVEWVKGDVLDIVSLEEAMQGIDTVIHSAAIVSFDPAQKKHMYKVNIEGTANVVNVSVQYGIKRFVHISSVAALGRTLGGGNVNEEKKWQESKVNTDYAKSKYRAEIEVWRGIAEDLDAVILNPSTILGVGDWHASSSRLFKSVFNGFPWYTKGVNGFVDVEDVAKATILLMESGISAERFIVSSENWTFQQLFNTIADKFDKPRPNKHATPFLGQIAWRVEKFKSWFGKKPVLTKESARVAQSSTYFENGKILKALPGFSFVPLEKTIEYSCKKYLQTIK